MQCRGTDACHLERHRKPFEHVHTNKLQIRTYSKSFVIPQKAWTHFTHKTAHCVLKCSTITVATILIDRISNKISRWSVGEAMISRSKYRLTGQIAAPTKRICALCGQQHNHNTSKHLTLAQYIQKKHDRLIVSERHHSGDCVVAIVWRIAFHTNVPNETAAQTTNNKCKTTGPGANQLICLVWASLFGFGSRVVSVRW